MTPSPGIEPGPHWWEASALTTAPSLHPQKCEKWEGAWVPRLAWTQASTRFSHAAVFVFPTIWEPGTGYRSIGKTLDSNDQNQVAGQRFSLKQWFAGGAQSRGLRKPGCGHGYLRFLSFHCLGTPTWPPWRHVKTLYEMEMNCPIAKTPLLKVKDTEECSYFLLSTTRLFLFGVIPAASLFEQVSGLSLSQRYSNQNALLGVEERPRS